MAGWVCPWGEYLRDPDEADLAKAMQTRENTGRPLGDEGFLKKLSASLGRPLLRKSRGRRPKDSK